MSRIPSEFYVMHAVSKAIRIGQRMGFEVGKGRPLPKPLELDLVAAKKTIIDRVRELMLWVSGEGVPPESPASPFEKGDRVTTVRPWGHSGQHLVGTVSAKPRHHDRVTVVQDGQKTPGYYAAKLWRPANDIR